MFIGQANAKIHLLAAIVVIIAAIYLNISTLEWCFIVFAISSVIMAEAFNTAIEYVVDLCSPEYHELAGKAKDVAAAAVLVAAFGAVGIACFIFIPKIFPNL